MLIVPATIPDILNHNEFDIKISRIPESQVLEVLKDRILPNTPWKMAVIDASNGLAIFTDHKAKYQRRKFYGYFFGSLRVGRKEHPRYTESGRQALGLITGTTPELNLVEACYQVVIRGIDTKNPDVYWMR